MRVPNRHVPDPCPDDRTALTQWLDWQRATVRAKCDGLDWSDPTRPLSELLDAYDTQCVRSREVAAVHDLDTVEQYAPDGLPLVSLRWTLGHLIEETARHLGHLDILRELTDGSRGY